MVQYVAAASNGDTDAMAKLYSKTLKASYFLAATLCSDEQKAADITKKAYARAFCTVDKLKKPEAFEIWMKQNVAAVYKESVKFVFADAEAGTAENSPEFLPESVLEDEEISERVMKAVAGLKPELKTALVLYYNNGMPVQILSKFLGVSESTGNALLGKARALVLAEAGIEAAAGGLSGTLPVLTRIFQRKAVETSIENSLVRDIFIFAIDAYEASKPAVTEETAQPEIKEVIEEKAAPDESVPQEEIPEETKEIAPEEEPASEETQSAPEAPAIPEASNIISFKQKISEILDSDKLPEKAEEPVEADVEENEIPDIPVTQASDADLKNFGAVSIDDEPAAEIKEEKSQTAKKKLDIKLNPKLIGIICAVLAVLVILGVVIGKVAGGSESGNGGSQSNSENSATFLWKAGGFSECTELGYLDENCAYFKSATTGKYGLIDYRGNVILQPNYDGFERCGSGRDYSGRDSYHSLVVIGNEKFEITVANGTVSIAENAHLPHSVPTESLDEDAAYDERDRYFEGYAAARKDGKWGYVSQEKDKKVIPYKYDAVNDLSASEAAYSDYCRPVTDGLIAVKLEGKMGIINLENDVVAPFEYDSIMPGSNGVFIANKGGVWGVILTGDAMNTFDGVNITVDILPEESTDAGEEALGKYEVTDEDGANVRSDAGSDFDKLGELAYGDVVIGYDTKEADNGNKWLKIKFNGEYGWVAMSMVEKAE